MIEGRLELAILEVGLGGRLDAVNIIDADVAVITTVDLDHQEFLGRDRETIGGEKAGIFRAGKPCVLAERDPPSSVLRRAYEIGAPAIRAQADYLVEPHHQHWTWREPGYELELPRPVLSAPAQIGNAAAAIAALRALPLEFAKKDFAEGLRREPSDELSWLTRGLAHLPGDPKRALHDFEQALELRHQFDQRFFRGNRAEHDNLRTLR